MSAGRPVAPAERVRASLARTAGAAAAAQLPSGYQRLGRVVIVALPEALRPHFAAIGQAWQEALGVETVLRRSGPVRGEWRLPSVEPIAGGPTETTVREHGVRWSFDAARLMFARGNRGERERIGRLARPGEAAADLFAGIGYFAIPLARRGADPVYACEINPESYRYLLQNVRANGVTGRVVPLLGDNRSAPLPGGRFDRVVLGYLPDSVPYILRAADLLRPEGGTVHVHLLQGTREADAEPIGRVRRLLGRAGRAVEAVERRVVKPYGPGREHIVLDVRVGAASAEPR